MFIKDGARKKNNGEKKKKMELGCEGSSVSKIPFIFQGHHAAS